MTQIFCKVGVVLGVGERELRLDCGSMLKNKAVLTPHFFDLCLSRTK